MSSHKVYVSDLHKDPITGTVGSHPIGVGIGATGAGVAAGVVGAAIGGPVGAMAGAAIGAVLGGLAGKATAEELNPTVEGQYWRENHASRPYALAIYGFQEYEPAYRYGWESFSRYNGEEHSFESFENELGRGWDMFKGSSKLVWLEAKDASRDAWNKVHDSVYGTSKVATHSPQKNHV